MDENKTSKRWASLWKDVTEANPSFEERAAKAQGHVNYLTKRGEKDLSDVLETVGILDHEISTENGAVFALVERDLRYYNFSIQFKESIPADNLYEAILLIECAMAYQEVVLVEFNDGGWWLDRDQMDLIPQWKEKVLMALVKIDAAMDYGT